MKILADIEVFAEDLTYPYRNHILEIIKTDENQLTELLNNDLKIQFHSSDIVNLSYWTKVLNKFDQIISDIIYNDLMFYRIDPTNTTETEQVENESRIQLLLAILSYTSELLDLAYSKDNYNSSEVTILAYSYTYYAMY